MSKKFGIVLIIVGILLGLSAVSERAKEINYINLIIQQNNGSCFLEDGTCLHNSQNLVPVYFGGTVSLGLIIGGIYFLLNGSKPKQEQKAEPTTELKRNLLLKDDEKLLIEKIKESQGTIFQSELVEKTGMTKVKITRILDKLEGKGIIERKRRGMTNVVILK
jgi:uncharacterized membrane protein